MCMKVFGVRVARTSGKDAAGYKGYSSARRAEPGRPKGVGRKGWVAWKG